MSDGVDIKDRKSLEAWLTNQPREVAVWIAFRAAARVLPVWWQAVLIEDWARKGDLAALQILRSVLISSVASVVRTDDIREAAGSAYTAARSAYAASLAADRAPYATRAVQAPTSNATHAASAAMSVADAASRATRATRASAAHATQCSAAAAAHAAVWETVRTDAAQVLGGLFPHATPLWPDGKGPLADQWETIKSRVAKAPDAQDLQFWVKWYDTLLAGHLMLGDAARTWEMLEKIALIDPEIWDKGPEVVNPVIREIWEGYTERGTGSGTAADPDPISDSAKSAMKQRVLINRDALAVSSAELLEQLSAYKDRVRGMTHLEPELRQEILGFIDEFFGKLTSLLTALPEPGSKLGDQQAAQLVLWLREYRGLLRSKMAYYASAENIAEATVPTGVILLSTGIGSMLGMPIPGAIVGGLIVNQMKPGQAAKELTKPSGKDGDGV